MNLFNPILVRIKYKIVTTHVPKSHFEETESIKNVTVDILGILPEDFQDQRTGNPVLNFDSFSILNFNFESQLQRFTVDCVKKAIQDLCWNCFRIAIRKRDFKMWLQLLPPDTPLFPYGRFDPLDFDSTWREVLNIHQIPLAAERLHLRLVFIFINVGFAATCLRSANSCNLYLLSLPLPKQMGPVGLLGDGLYGGISGGGAGRIPKASIQKNQ